MAKRRTSTRKRSTKADQEFISEAEEIIEHENAGRKVFVYHLTDLDRAGGHIEADIQQKLEHFGCQATFARLALTTAQVRAYDLPDRPEKRGQGRATELDALPPDVFRGLIRSAIEGHIDPVLWREQAAIEEGEREHLTRIAQRRRR